MARGAFVATCEGDDYWSDTEKLQRQVDFLRDHPEFTLCFHPVRIVYEDMPGIETTFPEHCTPQPSLADLATRNFIQTNSVLYRWRYRGAEPFAFDESIAPGDWYVHLMHAEVGRIGFLPQVMAVYRKHAGGMWTTHASEIARHRKLGTAEIELFRRLFLGTLQILDRDLQRKERIFQLVGQAAGQFAPSCDAFRLHQAIPLLQKFARH